MFLEVSIRTLSGMVVEDAEHTGCVCISWLGEIPNFKSVHAEDEDMEPRTLRRKEVIEVNFSKLHWWPHQTAITQFS